MAAPYVQAFFYVGDATVQDSTQGNTFKPQFPNAVLSGNCLILQMSWFNNPARTVTAISDTINGSWSTTALKSVVGANNTTIVFAFPNAGAGKTTLTITFSGIVQGPIIRLFEISGLATTAGALNSGGSATADVTGPALTCGSFTPTNNNGNGGNLILSFFDVSSGFQAVSNPTSPYFVPSTNFTLMHSDIGWSDNAGLPKAAAFWTQVTSAAVNPGMTASNDTTDTFNCLAVALALLPGQGTIPGSGIRIISIAQQGVSTQPNTWHAQWPVFGDTRLIENDIGTGSGTGGFDSISDTDGSYTFAPSDQVLGLDICPQFWTQQNKSQDTSNIVTLNRAGTIIDKGQCWLYDIVGGKLSGALIGANSTNAAVTAGLSVSHAPDHTPTTTGSLTIQAYAIGNGPCLSCTAPATAYLDVMQYTTINDSSSYDIGDAHAHNFNTSLTAQNWSFTQGTNSGGAAHAIELLAAPAVATTSVRLGILGFVENEW